MNQIQQSWELIITKLKRWGTEFIDLLPNILVVILLMIVTIRIAKSLKSWSEGHLGKIIKQKSIRGLISQFIYMIIVMMGILLSLSILGLEGATKSLLAGAGIAGIAIGLALQGSLSNTFSGIYLASEDDINVGDTISTGSYTGEVTAIDLHNTKIRESDNNIVIIPNAEIASKAFKNFSLIKDVRCSITGKVRYDADLELAEKTAVESIRNEFPNNDQSTIVFNYTNFTDIGVEFNLLFFVKYDSQLTSDAIKSKGILAIKKAFDSNGINMSQSYNHVNSKQGLSNN